MAFQPDRNIYFYKLVHGVLIFFPLKRNKNNSSNKNYPYDSIMQIIFYCKTHARHYCLRLESSIKLADFHELNCDLKYKLEIFLFL